MSGSTGWYIATIHKTPRPAVHIRPAFSKEPGDTAYLNETTSRLLTKTLQHISSDATIPGVNARQAVLRAFWDVFHTQ